MSRLHVLELDPRHARRWTVARRLALVGFAALVVALLTIPTVALTSLWDVAVPLLPASFFVTPALWRGICPLSTLNAWGNRFGPSRALTARDATIIGGLGLALFHLLVPARHLGLNTSGTLLAAVLLVVAALAIAMGAAFESRSAFCNALCPVLPVERLYGQAPVLDVERGRCARCTVCTPRGCLDLAEEKSLSQVFGAARHSTAWLRTPFGLFAASLPGFIVGYGLTPDVGAGLDAVVRVYGATLGGAFVSWMIVHAAVHLTGSSAVRAVAACAALSGMLYYWFAAAVITRDLSLPAGVTPAIRVAALAGIALWLGNAIAFKSGARDAMRPRTRSPMP